jgi:hypothetical protein
MELAWALPKLPSHFRLPLPAFHLFDLITCSLFPRMASVYYLLEKNKTFNKFVREFTVEFCDASGQIDWAKLVKFNSGNLGA